jgi:hypothetical protein
VIPTKFFVNTLLQGQQHSANKLTAQLRRTAFQAGWPSDATRTLTVVPYNKHYRVSYADAFSSAVEDAEYGTQSTPPNPVVRQFLTNLRHTEATSHVDSILRRAGLV